ncbi:uncharacterized protein LOC131857945 [Cryptomeria japonica]|uniref:uncharacterized protein LOC131857945 n=1 Tax=Cryptomeria japonica TaxID=3369 RepID=UPI0027D9F018|nr:uncharacterized protein LOC131857945 [Cryptomeria japonica]
MDCQLVVSKSLVLKYITKYASKAERKSESCIDMLTRICKKQAIKEQAIVAYHKFIAEIIADRDISAQEMLHMLQKLLLVVCNCSFMTLTVGRKLFHRIKRNQNEIALQLNYLHSYIQRPLEMETTTLIDSAGSFSFSATRKGCKWKKRKENTIVNAFPQFYAIPNEDSEQFKFFCRSDLHLYKHFRNISMEMGLTKDDIVANWKQTNVNKYFVWHVDHIVDIEENHEQDEDTDNEINLETTVHMNEWELLSQMGLCTVGN